MAAASSGNLVEWFDWYVFSMFSIYFASRFFPEGDETAQLLNAAGVFAIGFLMRPLGSWLFGRYSDRVGRRAALTLSMQVMCVGSLTIALIPDYTAIGVAAPLLLVAARIAQGLSIGGEYGVTATFLSEMAADGHRGVQTSMLAVTVILGQLVALGLLVGLQAVLTEAQLTQWGWRIGFLIGAAGSMVAFWLRRTLPESSAFEQLDAKQPKSSLRELMRYPRAVMIVIALSAGGTVAFYTFSTYMQKFMVNSAGWSRADASSVMVLALIVYLVLQPLFGALSDRLGRRPQLIVFGLAGIALIAPLLHRLEQTRDYLAGLGLIAIGLAIVSLYTSVSGVVKAELFPTHIRTLGVSFPYAITVSVFGGTAEFVGLFLKSRGMEPVFYWYVAATCGISLIGALLIRKSDLSLTEVRLRP